MPKLLPPPENDPSAELLPPSDPDQCSPAVENQTDKTLEQGRTRGPKRHCPGDWDAEIDSDFQQTMHQFMNSQSARLDKLEKHLLELVQQSSSIAKTNSDIEKSLNYMSEQITSVEVKIDALDGERTALVTQMTALEDKIANIDRQLIKTTVEIRDIPKTLAFFKDALFNMVQKLSTSLNLNIQGSDIRDIYRLPSKKEKTTTAIAVEFNNTLQKSNFLKKIKDHNKNNDLKKLSTEHLGYIGTHNAIYVSELLTPATKKLYFIARTFAKNHKYEYCWTSEGRVFLRKNKESQYLIVKDEEQLKLI